MRRLTAVAIFAVLTLGTAAMAAADPIAYTSIFQEGGCQLHSLDVTTGVATPVGGVTSDCTGALARSADGTLWSVTLDETGAATLVTVDRTTATATPVGPVGITLPLSGGGSFLALTVDPDGVLWLAANSQEQACADAEASSCIYRVDTSTGAGTLVGGTGQLLAGLAATCDDGLLATSWPDSSLYRVDPADASMSLVGALSLTSSAQGAATGPDGTVWVLDAFFTEFPFHTVTVDPATAATSQIAAVTGIDGIDAGGIALVPQRCSTPLVPTTTTVAVAAAATVAPSFTG